MIVTYRPVVDDDYAIRPYQFPHLLPYRRTPSDIELNQIGPIEEEVRRAAGGSCDCGRESA